MAADGSPIPRDGLANLTYNSTSNRITATGFEYDAAGNQTRALSEDGQTFVRYEYDSANRLRVIKKDDGTLLQGFMYGTSNARIFGHDFVSNQFTVYATLGGTTLSEYVEQTSAVPSWTKSYTYLGDSLLSTSTPNGAGGENTEYSHPDRLGTRTITNQQAGTSYEQTTLPFGTALNAESTASTNKRFTSYDRSNATGLDYAVNRTYDSKQGRFTQVDPIGMRSVSLSVPQTLNLYSYCGNDPINHTDPDGLFFGGLFKWLGRAIKIIMIAVAIAIAVIAIALMPSMAPIYGQAVFNKLFLLSGSLFAQALAPPKIGAVIGIITGMILSGPGVIANLGSAGKAAGGASKILKWLKLLVASNNVGAVANSFAQTGNKSRKKSAPPCPPSGQEIANESGLQKVWELAQDLSKLSGRFKEVGGWILAKKGNNNYIWQINIDPRNTVDRTFGFGEPQKYLGDLLKKGWYVVADFHTHGDSSPMNAVDEALSIGRKTPGIVIQPGGKPVPYGVEKGVFGIGIPKGCK